MKDEYEEEHFQIYNVLDRLREECQEQYGSLYKASKAYGSHHLNKYLGATAYSLGFKMLTKMCKFLNISYQYALFGGIKENFVEQKQTFKNFYKVYKELYRGDTDHVVYASYWFAKTGKQTTIPIKYLIKVAKKSRKTVDFLVGG